MKTNSRVKSCGCKIVDGILQKCDEPDCFFLKTCVVCGARLNRRRLYMCPNAGTCDSVCTRARDTGRTRIEQYFADDNKDKRLEQRGFLPEYHRVILAEREFQ